MRRILAIGLAAMLLALAGCGAAPEADSGKLQVVATVFPYYDFARAIGGEDAEVTLLVAAGREAHSFEPTPLDVIKVWRSDVFLYNGGESEAWVEEILDAAGENIRETVAIMDGLALLEEEMAEGMQESASAHDHESHHDHDELDHDEHDDHDDGEIEYDEHVWTSPVMACGICQTIRDALCRADPAHAEGYTARAEDYIAKLQDLDAQFREVVAGGRRGTLVFGDRFPLLYFCRTYGLDYRAAFQGCAADTEPRLGTLQYLIDYVGQEEIPVVYTIELSSHKIADAIAETTGAAVLTFESCQTVSRADYAAGCTYLDLMERNVDALREGLR
ncbi:MAG: zinc ABC transporter substrate-binding protein [Oscillospiraceae bacterium]|nr:zinc ABC transporter substrate-binding protein [Oscillospiraceae bacterium]MBR0211841.1 zinc ABC transporter substrate-binding protein [Oscillospiraceae bacterium]